MPRGCAAPPCTSPAAAGSSAAAVTGCPRCWRAPCGSPRTPSPTPSPCSASPSRPTTTREEDTAGPTGRGSSARRGRCSPGRWGCRSEARAVGARNGAEGTSVQPRTCPPPHGHQPAGEPPPGERRARRGHPRPARRTGRPRRRPRTARTGQTAARPAGVRRRRGGGGGAQRGPGVRRPVGRRNGPRTPQIRDRAGADPVRRPHRRSGQPGRVDHRDLPRAGARRGAGGPQPRHVAVRAAGRGDPRLAAAGPHDGGTRAGLRGHGRAG